HGRKRRAEATNRRFSRPCGVLENQRASCATAPAARAARRSERDTVHQKQKPARTSAGISAQKIRAGGRRCGSRRRAWKNKASVASTASAGNAARVQTASVAGWGDVTSLGGSALLARAETPA